VVVHAYNLGPQEAEAGGSQAQGQPGLHSKTLSKPNEQTNLAQRDRKMNMEAEDLGLNLI
jgi:hypothetical protein